MNENYTAYDHFANPEHITIYDVVQYLYENKREKHALAVVNYIEHYKYLQGMIESTPRRAE